MNCLAAFILRLVAEAVWESNPPRSSGGKWRDTGRVWCELVDTAERLESEAS